jgi:hypothetical protein
LLDQVDHLKDRVSTILDRAEAENNPRLALMAARELRGCLDLLGRVMGELNPSTTTLNVLLSPQWLHIRSTLFSALDVYPDARIAVVRGLSEMRPD